MAGNNYWMKLWFDILRDPKMGMLPDRLWRRVIELFLLAGQNGEDGILPDVPTIAWQLNKPVSAIVTDLQKIAEVGIVQEVQEGEWVVTNFKKRNEAVTPVKRMKDFRMRERYEKSDEPDPKNVTPPLRNSYAPVTIRNQEEQKNRLTDLTTTTTPTTPAEFLPFAEVYQSVTGSEPLVLNAELDAVAAIIAAGGTPEDYRRALQEMQDKHYSISTMASALNWTLKNIQKAKQPARANNGHKPKRDALDEILAGAPIFAEDK